MKQSEMDKNHFLVENCSKTNPDYGKGSQMDMALFERITSQKGWE